MSYYNSNFEEDLAEMLKSFKDDPERQVHMRLLADAFFENIQRDDVEFGGWGAAYAIGALHVLKGKPEDRILKALETAGTFSGGVGAPYTVLKLPKDAA